MFPGFSVFWTTGGEQARSGGGGPSLDSPTSQPGGPFGLGFLTKKNKGLGAVFDTRARMKRAVIFRVLCPGPDPRPDAFLGEFASAVWNSRGKAGGR